MYRYPFLPSGGTDGRQLRCDSRRPHHAVLAAAQEPPRHLAAGAVGRRNGDGVRGGMGEGWCK